MIYLKQKSFKTLIESELLNMYLHLYVENS